MSFSTSSCYSKMFPSSNNDNVDPIIYQWPFSNNIYSSNFTFDFDQPFVNFPPSPCYDYNFPSQSDEFLVHQEQQPLIEIQENLMVLESEQKKEKKKTVMTKKKKDRHSKIKTAQGLRDRRIRLSLKVARDFFDLQDRLRFDKASKTVEWLLLQACSATKLKSSSCPIHQRTLCYPPECEIVSRFVEEDEATKDRSQKADKGIKGKKAKPSRKTAFRPEAKELRQKARAEARERTRRKKMELGENYLNYFYRKLH